MKLKENLICIANKLNTKFTLNEKELSLQEVFDEHGLLPALARRADQLSSLCLGYGLGVTFDEIEKSLSGISVTFDEVTPDSVRLLCMTDVLIELVQMSANPDKTALDELLYD